MNINTYNYGHYRLTDYGRWKYQLFNRDTDYVCTPTKEEFIFIRASGLDGCRTIERNHLSKNEFVA